MKFRPKLNRVMLRKLTKDKPRPNEIIIPDSADQENFSLWEVIGIGDPRILESGERIPIDLKLGDIVLINARFSIDITCHDPDDENYGRELKICDYAGVMSEVDLRKGERLAVSAVPHFHKE